MTTALESLLRRIAFHFPGVRLFTQGRWAVVRQATAEERQRWGW